MWQANCGAWMNLVPRHGSLAASVYAMVQSQGRRWCAVGAPLVPSALCRGPDASGGGGGVDTPQVPVTVPAPAQLPASSTTKQQLKPPFLVLHTHSLIRSIM